ncbi:MAG TPA: FAD:protein FMN transferase [Methylomirabilota bacterium]|nr:FAD:protein FMN transferase [Methylomirabilota bacterium]
MKQTKLIMGMPITLEIIDKEASANLFQKIFSYFRAVDKQFSPYKKESEVSRMNNGTITASAMSTAMKEVLELAEQTQQETNGFFDVYHKGRFDPSGIVKGWAINNAASMLKEKDMKHFFIDAGGDIHISGANADGKPWRVGIRNPFNRFENVKILSLQEKGIATSGTAIRGQHIYNPHRVNEQLYEIVSLTVIGPTVYDADRFATAAFAMGRQGIEFLESQKEYEGYMIDAKGIATYTNGFEQYVL